MPFYRVLPSFFLLILLCFSAASCGSSGGNGTGNSTPPKLLLGAHYYTWFPDNFSQGYLRKNLVPKQQPTLGEYSSGSPEIVQQHISWASQAGIDFFTLDYWPTRPGFREQINAFIRADNISLIQFAVFYELWDLNFENSTQSTRINESERKTLRDDFSYFANQLFSHPSYLHFEGKPVVFLYLTRTLVGEMQTAVEEIRSTAREQGFELFLVADEIYWINTKESNGQLSISDTPNVERAKLFNALFMYNPYAPSFTFQLGHGANSSLIEDLQALYTDHRSALPDIPHVPVLIPGYNDRAVRLSENNLPIARSWEPEGEAGSFFEKMLKRFSLPNVDSRFPMLLITSWNEWNEDTAIEPLSGAAPTTVDNSQSGSSYTNSLQYSPYGNVYLEILSRELGN